MPSAFFLQRKKRDVYYTHMSNTSKKRRNKKIRTGIIITIIMVLVGSFIVSQRGSAVDPAVIESISVSEPTPHVKGNAESGITLIEYSDFQCPACKNAAPQISAIVEDFGDQFQLEYRHLPLRSIHPNAQAAAQAAEAAGMQGKFWEMHDMLFERQSEWAQSFNPERFFRNYANDLGIHADRLVYDMESDIVKNIIETQVKEAQDLGLPGTPSFVFNGEIIDINQFVAEHIVVVPETM
jgi:protein-disulfide isomerase